MLTKFNLLVEKHIKSLDITKVPMFKINKMFVYSVDGSEMRNKVMAEYMGGGHGYVYNFVPKKEIWLEKTVIDDEPAETLFLLFHELCELTLMTKHNQDYLTSHNFSNSIE